MTLTMTFSIIWISYIEFTYLFKFKAFLIVFPHDKKVVIADDKVHPVP